MWADDPPDEAGGSEDFCVGADEAVLLSRVAKVWNVGKHPCLHTELYSACEGSSYDLTCTAFSEARDRKKIKTINPRTWPVEGPSCSDQA